MFSVLISSDLEHTKKFYVYEYIKRTFRLCQELNKRHIYDLDGIKYYYLDNFLNLVLMVSKYYLDYFIYFLYVEQMVCS